MRRSVPEYTTILAQVFSPCGQYYAAGTVEVQVAVWKVSQLVARGEVDRGKELAREGGEQHGDREGRGHRGEAGVGDGG